MQQAKFVYSPLGKALEKQTKKLVVALKSLNPSNKKDELKHAEGMFPQNLMNDLKLLISKILLKQMSYIINQNVEKFLILVNILYLLFFQKYIRRIFIIKRC